MMVCLGGGAGLGKGSAGVLTLGFMGPGSASACSGGVRRG